MSRTEKDVKKNTVLKDGILYHKLTKELFINHKKEDKWTDRRIMERYGMHNNEFQKWKKDNLTEKEISSLSLRNGTVPVKRKAKAKPEPIREVLNAQKVADIKRLEEKLADLSQDYDLLSGEYAAAISLAGEHEEKHKQEILELNTNLASLEDAVSYQKEKRVENSYEIENLRELLRSSNLRVQRLVDENEVFQAENEALRNLVKVWI